MNCPNCKEFMEQLCMSGNDLIVEHEFHCSKCYTYLYYSYNPKVTDRIINTKEAMADEV